MSEKPPMHPLEPEVAAPPSKTRLYLCEVCGRDKPVNQVFQCTVCTKYFCVTHVGPWTHDCYTNE